MVPLNVGEEDEKAMREAMEEKRRQARLAKVNVSSCETVAVLPFSTLLYCMTAHKLVHNTQYIVHNTLYYSTTCIYTNSRL